MATSCQAKVAETRLQVEDDNPFVENIENCRAGHEYVVMLWVNPDGSGSFYVHEDSMAYCPRCGLPSQALSDEESGISGADLEGLRSFYEDVRISMGDESQEKLRPVHVDVLGSRRER